MHSATMMVSRCLATTIGRRAGVCSIRCSRERNQRRTSTPSNKIGKINNIELFGHHELVDSDPEVSISDT